VILGARTPSAHLPSYRCSCKTFLWRRHAVDRSTVPWLLDSKVICSSRYLFRSAANCTWLPLGISKVPVLLHHPVLSGNGHTILESYCIASSFLEILKLFLYLYSVFFIALRIFIIYPGTLHLFPILCYVPFFCEGRMLVLCLQL